MVNLLSYILQVCGWFVPLYLLYLFIFKNYTFHNWNRWYLLLMGVASFGFPFIHYKIIENRTVYASVEKSQQLQTSFIETENNSINDIITNTVDHQPQSWQWLQLLAVLYFIGLGITGAKLLYSLFNIKRLIEKAKKTWNSGIAMVFTTDNVPHSSFFSYIFINKKAKADADLDKIIYHEMQHNEKLHSVDVLWCEILKVVMWFNPAVYGYKKSLQEIHEFEVDVEMAKLYNKESYAQLLLKVASLNWNKLISTFSSKPLKTRIMMMFNPKTYPLKKLTFLLVLPLVAILLMAYGNVKRKTITTVRTIDKINKQLTLVIDAGHGGTDPGAKNNGYTESEITLAVAKKLALVGKEAGFNIVLTRSTDSAVAIKDRAALATQVNADAFISLHVNHAKNTSKNGIESYRPNKAGLDTINSLSNKILNGLSTLSGIKTNLALQSRAVSIYVIQNNIVNSALIELGYLSNKNDLKFITNAENQQLIAEKIVQGINNYFGNNSK